MIEAMALRESSAVIEPPLEQQNSPQRPEEHEVHEEQQ
jgi:hypothetical protein